MKITEGTNARICRAVMNAIIPRGGAFERGALDYDLLPKAEVLINSFDPYSRLLFPLLFRYIQYSAIFHTGQPFTSLSDERAVHYLDSLEQSRFFYKRGMVTLLKLMTTLTFFDSDEVAGEIGYCHGCHLKASPKEG